MEEGKEVVILAEDILDNQNYLENSVSHEIAHSLDQALTTDGVYSSAPYFKVYLDHDDSVKPVGRIAKEIYSIYENGSSSTSEYFRYPLDNKKYKYDVLTLQKEIFAQVWAMFAHPKGNLKLQELAPFTHSYFNEVLAHAKTSLTSEQKPKANQTQSYAISKGSLRSMGKNVSRDFESFKLKAKPAKGLARYITSKLYDGRKIALGFMITRDLINDAAKYMSSTMDYLGAVSQRNEIAFKILQPADAIRMQAEKLSASEAKAVNQLIAKSTVDGVWPYQPTNKPKAVVSPELAKIFNALSKEQQKIIRDTFTLGDTSLKAKQDAVRNFIDKESDGDDAVKAEMTATFGKILNLNNSTPYAPCADMATLLLLLLQMSTKMQTQRLNRN